jgi:Spy/CpxP family protein refolding chaperone
MKTLLLALGCTLAFSAVTPAFAQDKPAAAQLTSAELLARIQSDKKGIVAKSMNLTPEEAKKFWPLYETFQRELEVPQRASTRAQLDYIAADHSLTDANAKRIAEQVLAASLEEARLQQKHFKQLLKVLPATKAARYMQIENKIQAVVRFESAKAIPLVN